MRQKKFWFTMSGILAVLAIALMLPAGAVAASKYKVLHKFTSADDGAFPHASLIFDAAGNLYGTTEQGVSGCGTVFKLRPNPDGSWTESVLHAFYFAGGEGCNPTASLIFDAVGNLYGTTSRDGGTCDCGVVFKLTPGSNGSWAESVLYSFTAGTDGASPYAGLTFDGSGNLYGTTARGGGSANCNGGCGVVFELTPNGDGTWTVSVLHRFRGGSDGANSSAGLIFDGSGNLYGTTTAGGGSANCGGGCGTVFKLTPNSHGSWTVSVLHSFTNGADGIQPAAGLIFDVAGNLYGTTEQGGENGFGVVFKLHRNSDGSWKEQVLHDFANRPAAFPVAGLTFDAAGNLYGTTIFGGGGAHGGGTVFKLTPRSRGGWTYDVLRVFRGKPALHPSGGLILDNTGNLYGTTQDCATGYHCQGVVFEITP